MPSEQRPHPPEEASRLAERIANLTKAMQRAIERDELEQLPEYLEERERAIQRLRSSTVTDDVEHVRALLSETIELDRTTTAFLSAELSQVERERDALTRWRSSLGSYRTNLGVAAPSHVDRLG